MSDQLGKLWPRVGTLALAALLAACSINSRPPADQTDHIFLTLPVPPGLDRDIVAVQQLEAAYSQRRVRLQALVEASSDRVAVALNMPLGPRVATIEWTAKAIEMRRDIEPADGASVEPSSILQDMVLVYWPEELVRRSLDAGYLLTIDDHGRTVTESGRTIAVIRYDDDDPWNGRTWLRNEDLGYELSIISQVAPDA
ncbi:MAG: DUF3261 domain-containing protein [Pseudomonadota bacterium]